MTPEQFTYWLQGFVELNPPGNLTGEQWKIICDHLKTVFHKVTPDYDFGKQNPPWNPPLTPHPYKFPGGDVIC